MCGRALGAEPPADWLSRPLEPGEQIGPGGRYRILTLIGYGGFGSAFQALDIALDRLCVVKQLRLDPKWSAEQRRQVAATIEHEARLLVSLNSPGHPNIPEIYEYLAEHQALVMKLIDGESLKLLLKRRVAPLPEDLALRYARDICGALAYMHSRQPAPMLHRDLKPANLLIDSEERIWLIDFGLALGTTVLNPDEAQSPGASAGTLGYTPPEQWGGRAEPRSDIYALGATLYELLTNRRPPLRPTAPPSVLAYMPDLLPEVDLLVRRAMAEQPADRPHAGELLELIDAAREALDLPRPPVPAHPPPSDGLLGRADDLARLRQQVPVERVVVLSGMAGVGKTALAAAYAVAAPALVWHTFRVGDSGETLLWSLAGALAQQGRSEVWRQLQRNRRRDAQPPPFEALADYLAHALDSLDLLIVLDDLHLLDEDAQVASLIGRLVESARRGGPHLLITGRSLPGWLMGVGELRLGGLAPAASAALVWRRGLRLEPATLGQLCVATEGQPQLLLLACEALRRSAAPDMLVERLAHSADIARYLLHEIDAQLNDAEREVMEAVAALLGEGGDSDTVAALVEGRRTRYLLHELTARNLLSLDGDETDAIYRQHIIVQSFYYNGLRAAQRLALHRRAAAHFEHVAPNPLRAARHLIEADEPIRAATLLIAGAWALINTGQARVLADLLDRVQSARCDGETQVLLALARGDVGLLLHERAAAASYKQALSLLAGWPDNLSARELRARACRGLGRLLEHEDPQQALSWLRCGLVELGALTGQEAAQLYYRIGSVLCVLGEYDAALGELEQSLRLLLPEATALRANALLTIGSIHCSRGNTEDGVAYYRQAYAMYEQQRDSWGMIKAQHNIAIETEIAGNWAAAAVSYQQALTLAERIGAIQEWVGITLSLGILSAHRGDLATAAATLVAAAVEARARQLNEYLVAALSSLADTQIQLGDWLSARTTLDEAEHLALAIESRYQLPEILRCRAQIQLFNREATEAVQTAQQAVNLAHELAQDLDLGIGERVLGQVLAVTGDSPPARAAFVRSLALLSERDPYEAARTQAALGQLLAATGDPKGDTLLAAAHATFDRLGVQAKRRPA